MSAKDFQRGRDQAYADAWNEWKAEVDRLRSGVDAAYAEGKRDAQATIDAAHTLLARARDVLASLEPSQLAELGEAYLIEHIGEVLK